MLHAVVVAGHRGEVGERGAGWCQAASRRRKRVREEVHMRSKGGYQGVGSAVVPLVVTGSGIAK
ncbi:MAG: hypothetical protein WKG07_39255 [Hymenobacter sp.]